MSCISNKRWSGAQFAHGWYSMEEFQLMNNSKPSIKKSFKKWFDMCGHRTHFIFTERSDENVFHTGINPMTGGFCRQKSTHPSFQLKIFAWRLTFLSCTSGRRNIKAWSMQEVCQGKKKPEQHLEDTADIWFSGKEKNVHAFPSERSIFLSTF